MHICAGRSKRKGQWHARTVNKSDTHRGCLCFSITHSRPQHALADNILALLSFAHGFAVSCRCPCCHLQSRLVLQYHLFSLEYTPLQLQLELVVPMTATKRETLLWLSTPLQLLSSGSVVDTVARGYTGVLFLSRASCRSDVSWPRKLRSFTCR